VIVTLQIGNLINQIGAQSLLGAASGVAVIQQAAPLASGMLLGGAGASAIAADLGARTIRDEIDAMRVMGINPLNRLVVPRVIAATIVAPLLAMFIILVGVVASYYLSVSTQGVRRAVIGCRSVRSRMCAIWRWRCSKRRFFGMMIAVIGCQRGLEAKGGPRGVADGVNATVVVSSVAIHHRQPGPQPRSTPSSSQYNSADPATPLTETGPVGWMSH
jgi:phospholipid/cholesterol/gamma-HCH transport system permease protein